PGAEQAFAHGSECGVERAKEGDLGSSISEERFHELQVADSYGVEHQIFLAIVESDAVHMLERSALSGTHVVQDRSSRSRSRRLAVQAKALQRDHPKVVFQQRHGVIG